MAKKSTIKKKKVQIKPKKKTQVKTAKKSVVHKKPSVKKKVSGKASKIKKQPPRPIVKKKVVKKTIKVSKPTPKSKVKSKPVQKKATVRKVKLVKKPVAKSVKQLIKKIVSPVKLIEKKPLPKAAPKPNKLKAELLEMLSGPKLETNYNRADMFYKNVLNADILKRYSPRNIDDKEFVAMDYALKIKMGDREVHISEKSREQDWNDIYVEIYRKYPEEEGWIKYTQADYLGYFFPGRVFWAEMAPIKQLCFEILAKASESDIYKELSYMYPKNSGRLSKTFKINTKTYSFNFIQTYYEKGDHSYYSIGISLPFVLLMDFRIAYKIYKQ